MSPVTIILLALAGATVGPAGPATLDTDALAPTFMPAGARVVAAVLGTNAFACVFMPVGARAAPAKFGTNACALMFMPVPGACAAYTTLNPDALAGGACAACAAPGARACVGTCTPVPCGGVPDAGAPPCPCTPLHAAAQHAPAIAVRASAIAPHAAAWARSDDDDATLAVRVSG